jgi:hypothetical protein
MSPLATTMLLRSLVALLLCAGDPLVDRLLGMRRQV